MHLMQNQSQGYGRALLAHSFAADLALLVHPHQPLEGEDLLSVSADLAVYLVPPLLQGLPAVGTGVVLFLPLHDAGDVEQVLAGRPEVDHGVEADAALLGFLLSLHPEVGLRKRKNLPIDRTNSFEDRSLWGIEFFPAIVISAFFPVDANNDNDDNNEGYKPADSAHYDWN